MNIGEINDVLSRHGFWCGRMLSGTKTSPKGNFCVWNANIVTKGAGKVWYGDLNLTKDEKALNEIEEEIGEPLYVLHEMDARFENEGKPANQLITKAIWKTNEPVPTRD